MNTAADCLKEETCSQVHRPGAGPETCPDRLRRSRRVRPLRRLLKRRATRQHHDCAVLIPSQRPIRIERYREVFAIFPRHNVTFPATGKVRHNHYVRRRPVRRRPCFCSGLALAYSIVVYPYVVITASISGESARRRSAFTVALVATFSCLFAYIWRIGHAGRSKTPHRVRGGDTRDLSQSPPGAVVRLRTWS